MDLPVYNKTDDPASYQDDLSQTLVKGLSDNGWTLPQQTTTNITDIESDMPDGTMWYDTDTDQFKVKVGGTIKVVTVT